MTTPAITIVGGGILGITLGVLARIAGMSVRIVTEERADKGPIEETDPSFASVFPAASVLPHSVDASRLGDLMDVSLRMFEVFRRTTPDIVRRQWHYEVFEDEVPNAPYLSQLDDVEHFPLDEGDCPIRRSPDVPVGGWRFRCYFVEMPPYIETLFGLFEELGGVVQRRTIRGPEELESLKGDAVVVCAGMGTPDLLGRREPKYFEEGHLLHLPVGLKDLGCEAVSYNYMPRAEIHPNGRGGGMDVYAYPRRDALILGGTRLRGVQTQRGKTEVEAYPGRTMSLGDQGHQGEVPAPLVELNEILVEQLLGKSIRGLPKKVVVGRRYRGLTPDGEVVEVSETLRDRPLFGCYGLGGGGVTLSWGLAARLLSKISQELGDDRWDAAGISVEELADRLEAKIHG